MLTDALQIIIVHFVLCTNGRAMAEFFFSAYIVTRIYNEISRHLRFFLFTTWAFQNCTQTEARMGVRKQLAANAVVVRHKWTVEAAREKYGLAELRAQNANTHNLHIYFRSDLRFHWRYYQSEPQYHDVRKVQIAVHYPKYSKHHGGVCVIPRAHRVLFRTRFAHPVCVEGNRVVPPAPERRIINGKGLFRGPWTGMVRW